MRCPHCGQELGEGLLPARCPACGSRLSAGASHGAEAGSRASADRAAASRRSVEGLSGRGAGRRDRSHTAKRVGRVLLGFVLVAAFAAAVVFVAWRSEIIGGRTVPDVTGWNSASATAKLEEKGFAVGTNEVSDASRQAGVVVGESPTAGQRVDAGSTVTIDVVVAEAGA